MFKKLPNIFCVHVHLTNTVHKNTVHILQTLSTPKPTRRKTSLAEVIPDWPELKPFAKKKQVQLLETMTQQPFTCNQSGEANPADTRDGGSMRRLLC
jgi:hypothetical protein